MIHNISLAECLEQSAPPGKVLNVGSLDDTVFVRICEVSQDGHSETHMEVAEISVSLPALIEALSLLAGDGDREELRPRESTGTAHETRLAGRRIVIAPTGPHSAVAALADHMRYTEKPGDKTRQQPDGTEGGDA